MQQRSSAGHIARLAAGALVLALAAAPAAEAAGEGKPVRLGKRNPTKGSVTRTTQVAAKTKINTYALRADNRGLGGALLLGCRSALAPDFSNPRVSTACLRAQNTAGGEAFQFTSAAGGIIGVIQTGATFATQNPNVRPFVTNATGEALGLNADKVDGMNAQDIITAARQQNPIASSPSFAFARVATDGKTDQSRSQGVNDTNIKKGTQPGVYCFYGLTSRPKSANVTLDGVPGETSVDTTTGAGAPCPEPIGQLEMHVRTYDSAGAPADKPFYLTITGTG